MFEKAIEEIIRYTTPVCTISRDYGELTVCPGAATLFFVNEEGCAVTCRHVAELLLNRDNMNRRYVAFKEERDQLGKKNYNQRIRDLENRYGYRENVTIQLKEIFVRATREPQLTYTSALHPQYDLAIIRINDFKNPAYESFARFAKDSGSVKPGKMLCRLGYPFPEFSNFRYNRESDDIEWTDLNVSTPYFPIDGMVTRQLHDGQRIFGIELSTPGLRGQSGGPLFDEHGTVYGMQFSTKHLHLGFDMRNQEIQASGKTIRVSNQPFLHVGWCIHADIIKDFLRQNGVKYYEI
ncbi:MAG TPA: serine protease [Flavisolibacter sp.]